MNRRLTRESALRVPGNRVQPAPRLAVGDLAVYACHGIGRVESRERQPGAGVMLVLVFENGLRVTLPLDRAQKTLRSLSGRQELADVQRTLGRDAPPALEHWSRRQRNSHAKLVDGSVCGLAEIVRDGVHRERERVERGTAPMRTELYREAHKLLVAEVAAARGVEPDEAEDWIVEQINGDPLTTARARIARRRSAG